MKNILRINPADQQLWQTAAVTATIMTLYESAKELFFSGSLSLWESHAITILVTTLLAMLAASTMKSWAQSVAMKEKEVVMREQALKSFNLTLTATNHIVNNMLNYLQLINVEIELEGKVRADSLKLLNDSIQAARVQMEILNGIKNPSDPSSYKGIFPG